MRIKNTQQLLVIIALFATIMGMGQNKTLDSLRHQLDKLTDNEEIIENYRAIINMFTTIDMGLAVVYTQKLKEFSEINDYEHGFLYYNVAAGVMSLYNSTPNLEKAKLFFFRSTKNCK